jgi:hypothetical protein
MSYAARIRQLAGRVAESRRPKRLQATMRLARDRAPQPAAEETSALPAVAPVATSQQAGPSLPLSEQAARWLTHGQAPADLVPMLGDPTPPSRPASDPQTGSPQGSRQVLARIIEGGQVASAAAAAEHSPLDPGSPANRPETLPAAPESFAGRPETAIQELPGVHQTPPMLRLARAPQQPSSARDLALLSGGDLSEDGPDTSTVLFRSPAADARPPAPVPANPPASPAKSPPAGPAAAEPPAKQAVSPCEGSAESGAAQRSDAELDELYEALLQRLRRDLIHDRERLGDLLGPLR